MKLSTKFTSIVIAGTKPGATTTQRPKQIGFNQWVASLRPFPSRKEIEIIINTNYTEQK